MSCFKLMKYLFILSLVWKLVFTLFFANLSLLSYNLFNLSIQQRVNNQVVATDIWSENWMDFLIAEGGYTNRVVEQQMLIIMGKKYVLRSIMCLFNQFVLSVVWSVVWSFFVRLFNFLVLVFSRVCEILVVPEISVKCYR